MTEDNIRDEAADRADCTVTGLHALSQEGIYQRVQRTRTELFSVCEALELMGAALNLSLEQGLDDPADRQRFADQIEELAMAKAFLLNAIRTAGLSRGKCQKLEELFVGTMNSLTPQGVRDFFIGFFSDPNRDDQVAALNALFFMEADRND